MSNTDSPAPDPEVSPLFAQVVRDYRELEPGEGDTWNPLLCDVELLHRLELFRLLTVALRRSPAPPSQIRVLDIGCGNGRSARSYLDLGLLPEQVTALDLRPGALARASASHPGLNYVQHDGGALPFDDEHFDWVSTCTVFSSVREPEARRALGTEIARVLSPHGRFFYWDLLSANDFAGGDPLRPETIFTELTIDWSERTRIGGFRSRERRLPRALATLFDGIERLVGPATHQAVLLKGSST
ncbi:MAG: methyltransferase domain-containing protein [Acidobacteriota bacterium]